MKGGTKGEKILTEYREELKLTKRSRVLGSSPRKSGMHQLLEVISIEKRLEVSTAVYWEFLKVSIGVEQWNHYEDFRKMKRIWKVISIWGQMFRTDEFSNRLVEESRS